MAEKKEYDYLEPIEVAKGVYWIGFYDEKAAFLLLESRLLEPDLALLVMKK